MLGFRRRSSLIGEIRRLNLDPGDKLVITCPEELTAAEAERIVGAFERFAPGVSIAVLDCGRSLSVLRASEEQEAKERQPVFVLSPSWDQTQQFARRWARSAPGRAVTDVRQLDGPSDLSRIGHGATVVELPGAERGQHYHGLCTALSHKGARFFSDGTELEPGEASTHPLPPFPPPPPKDPGKPSRWGPGA